MTRFVAVLLAAAHLALATEGHGRIGLLRTRASVNEAVAQAPEAPLIPLPNDTISADYWNMVNTAIEQAALTTSRQPTLNDPAPTATPLPWEQVMRASQPVAVVDTAAAASSVQANWELATPLPPDAAAAQQLLNGRSRTAPVQRSMGVTPYDMQIGANVMYGLSAHNTETPPPSQEIVNEVFVAQCPMVMFSSHIHVRGPRCGNPMGEWVDPVTERSIMRWQNDGAGLRFGVDSVVSGNGSATFATLQETFSISSYFFELRNCLNVMRYNIEEQIIKVNHMAPRAHSTAIAHDQANTREAIFYRYIIRHPNGTEAAKTAMFRMGQDQVNISLPAQDNEAEGMLISTATRVGHWTRNQWRECTGTHRGWALDYSPHALSMDVGATVQDLRVASAALITLMAWRDEAAGADGFQHTGQGAMYFSLVSSVLWVFVAFIAAAIFWIVLTKKGLDKKLRRFFFRLEGALMPRRPVKVREPILRPTY